MQASIEDAKTFPFTPQQRKMIWYERSARTVVTPIRSAGAIVAARSSSMPQAGAELGLGDPRGLRSLAEAIGARLALARLGDHLASDGQAPKAAPTRGRCDAPQRPGQHRRVRSQRRGPGRDGEPDRRVAARPAVRRERQAAGPRRCGGGLAGEALANERLLVRHRHGETARRRFPMMLEGERFAAIEVELSGGRPLAPSRSSSCGRSRCSPRRRTRAPCAARARATRRCTDPLTGLLNFRAINEALVEGVHAAQAPAAGRSPSGCSTSRGSTRSIAPTATRSATTSSASSGTRSSASVAPRGLGRPRRRRLVLVRLPGDEAEEAAVEARMLVERIEEAFARAPSGDRADDRRRRVSGPRRIDRRAHPVRALGALRGEGRGAQTTSSPREPATSSGSAMRRAAFVRIVTEQEVPAASRGRQSPS